MLQCVSFSSGTFHAASSPPPSLRAWCAPVCLTQPGFHYLISSFLPLEHFSPAEHQRESREKWCSLTEKILSVVEKEATQVITGSG